MLINWLSYCPLYPKLKLATFTYFPFLFPLYTYKKSFGVKFWTPNKNVDFELYRVPLNVSDSMLIISWFTTGFKGSQENFLALALSNTIMSL